jgi:hypothetical protein
MIQCSCLPLLQPGSFDRANAQPSREFHPTLSGPMHCHIIYVRQSHSFLYSLLNLLTISWAIIWRLPKVHKSLG